MSNFYSKGPWKALYLKVNTGVQIKSNEGEYICTINSGYWQNNIGNSELISLAPEMIDNIKELVFALELINTDKDFTDNEIMKLRDIITSLPEIKKKYNKLTKTKI